MKTIYRFSYFSNPFHNIEDSPNDLVNFDNGSRAEIKISKSSKDFEPLLEWTKKHNDILISGSAFEKYIFTEDEQTLFELYYFSLIKDVPSEMSGETFGTKYKLIKKCRKLARDIDASKFAENWLKDKYYDDFLPEDKEIIKKNLIDKYLYINIYEQTSPLYLDTRKLSKKLDIQKTFTDELIISIRLKKLLEKNNISGWKTEPVYRPKKITWNGDVVNVDASTSDLSEEWFQLVVSARAPKMDKITKFGDQSLSFKKAKSTIPVNDCNLVLGIQHGSWPHFDRAKFPGSDFVCSAEMQVSAHSSPMILISRKLYELLEKNKIKGFETLPAFFTDKPASEILKD